MMNVGENIKRLRIDAGLSQSQLAAMIGKTRSAISQYESGVILPRMGVIEDLARVFRVNKNAIINGVEYAVVYLPDDESSTAAEERELLDLFRKMDDSDRAVLLDTARRFAAFSRIGRKDKDASQ